MEILKMAKKNDDENLFNLSIETEDIKLPGDATMTITKPAEEGKPDTDLKKNTINNDLPPLLAVDVAEGDKPDAGTIVQGASETKEKIESDITSAKEKETESKNKPEETKETKDATLATQGQQGSVKDAQVEENLSPMYLHAAALLERGILPNLDLEKLKDLEPLAVAELLVNESRLEVTNQAESLNEQYRNQFNDEQKRVLEMIGEGVPFDDAANVVYNQQRYDSIDETTIKESTEIQERLYREFLLVKGHNQAYIDRAVKQSRDLENLEADGITSHKELIGMASEQEKLELANAARIKEEQKENNRIALENIQKDVNGTKAIFEGIELSKKDQEAIINYMTVPAAEINHNGRKIQISKMEEIRRQNPLEFNKRIAYLIHLGYFNDNPSIPVLEKKGETNSVNKLAESLAGPDKGLGSGKPVIRGGEDKNEEISFSLPQQINTVRHS